MNRAARHRLIRMVCVLGVCGWASGLHPARPQAAAPVKLTAMVPMRDGTLLATDVYLPAGDGPWPVALARTPYGKGGYNGPAVNQIGAVLAAQDVRGRGASKGQARPLVDEGWGERQDGADTVAWIRQQPWCNGKIATFGFSYSGINQLLLAGTGVEGIVGQHVSFGAGSVYHDVLFQHGVWRKGYVEAWLKATTWPKDVLAFDAEHPRYDALWAAVDFGSRPEQAHWPIVLVGGWFDLFTQGTLDAFSQLQDRGGAGAQGQQHLVIGPWVHGGDHQHAVGQLQFPRNADWPSDAPEASTWLSFWLTGKPAIPPDEPAVRYYVMDDVTDRQAPGNVWRAADHWPPPSQPLRLYLTAEGGLDRQSPAAATREYDDDPAHPVPTVGGQDILIGSNGPQDQRRVETRPDVLLFTTSPLAEPIEVTGRLSVRLHAASSASNTDFTAKLTDVYPDGRSMLVTDGIVRASYRESLLKADPIIPGQRYAYDIDIGSTSIIFNRGHRIRVAISSSNYPRFDKNPNSGEDWPYAKQLAPIVAHQTIFVGGTDASYLVLAEVVGSNAP
jgi:predicted acyl esterase